MTSSMLYEGHPTSETEMRKVYCQTLMDAAQTNGKIAIVNCDLCSSMGLTAFAKQYPERAYNMGIQEANGLSFSAGLALTGYLPFFHTFAIFASRRVFDQAFVSCAYAGLNVKIVGGDPGVSATANGGTHMAFEDIGLMRTIPGMRVLDVCDTTQLQSVVKQMIQYDGVEYLRLLRKATRRIYNSDTTFTIGTAKVLREGTDASIIACGLEVYEALCAAELLASENISVRVVDMFTIKPIDKECIADCAARTGAIVTAENHNVIGGLGSAVAEMLVETKPVPMERVGVQDEFGEVGQQGYLLQRFGLTAQDIAHKVCAVLKRKG